MSWKEKQTGDRNNVSDVSPEKVKVFELEKSVSLPTIGKEPGTKPFSIPTPQPIRSPGIYEAEFIVNGEDVVFHFWPDGYHKAERDGKNTPHFKKDFPSILNVEMAKTFEPTKVSISEDRDMGSWFVRVPGLATKPFHFELCVKAAEAVHKGLGGTS